MTVLNPRLIALIQKRRAEGATCADIELETGLSHGTVWRATQLPATAPAPTTPQPEPTSKAKTPKPSKAPKAKASKPTKAAKAPEEAAATTPVPDPPEDYEEPSLDDVRRWLGQQVRDLRSESRRLRRDKPEAASAYATISRNLTAAATALARLTPKPAADPSENPDMVQAAEEARLQLHELLDRVVEDPTRPFLPQPEDGSSS